MYYDHRLKQLIVNKSLNHDDILNNLPSNTPFTLHWRMRTHGAVHKDYVHPFKIRNDLYVMHNGIINNTLHGKYNPNWSDTAIFIETELKVLLQDNPRLILDKGIQHMLGVRIGSGNRLAIQYKDNLILINENLYHTVRGTSLKASNTYAYTDPSVPTYANGYYSSATNWGNYTPVTGWKNDSQRNAYKDTLKACLTSGTTTYSEESQKQKESQDILCMLDCLLTGGKIKSDYNKDLFETCFEFEYTEFVPSIIFELANQLEDYTGAGYLYQSNLLSEYLYDDELISYDLLFSFVYSNKLAQSEQLKMIQTLLSVMADELTLGNAFPWQKVIAKMYKVCKKAGMLHSQLTFEGFSSCKVKSLKLAFMGTLPKESIQTKQKAKV
jgi:hypothetical protein